MARTGRPKAENPINIRTSVRFDKQTDEKLELYCKKSGLSKGEAIRKAVIQLLEEKK